MQCDLFHHILNKMDAVSEKAFFMWLYKHPSKKSFQSIFHWTLPVSSCHSTLIRSNKLIPALNWTSWLKNKILGRNWRPKKLCLKIDKFDQSNSSKLYITKVIFCQSMSKDVSEQKYSIEELFLYQIDKFDRSNSSKFYIAKVIFCQSMSKDVSEQKYSIE